MADADATPMHEDFPDWYGEVNLDPAPARLRARWKGISTLLRDADRDTVQGLLLLTHQSRHLPAALLPKIRQPFKATDATFTMRGNDRELQILAASCLAVLIETDPNLGPFAALSATTSGLDGARHPNLPMNLAALGEFGIRRWGEAIRTRPALTTHANSEPPPLSFTELASKVTDQQSWEAVADALKLAGSTTQLAIRHAATRHAGTIQAFARFLSVQDEELQMLWWLTGRRSSDYDCAFDGISADARPFVLAKELADKTQFLPGPPSVKGILSLAGLNERQTISIPDAVNAAHSDWLQAAMGELQPCPVSTPLHEAIKRQLETGAGTAWVAGWAATTGVVDAYAPSHLSLGNLFYRERLLLCE